MEIPPAVTATSPLWFDTAGRSDVVLPNTTMILVGGLQIPRRERIFQTRNWLRPFNLVENFAIPSPEIVGEQASEVGMETAARSLLDSLEDQTNTLFCFCAKDIGGTIVKLVVSEQCATLGIENEVVIPSNRSFEDLQDQMSKVEACTLQQHVLAMMTACWPYFTNFITLISRGIQCQYLTGKNARQNSRVVPPTTLVVNPVSILDPPKASEHALQKDQHVIRNALYVLASRDLELAKWALNGLMWVAFSIRPLTIEELDSVLLLEADGLPTLETASSDRLIQLLPGALRHTSGHIFFTTTRTEVEDILIAFTNSLTLPTLSPHIHIAKLYLRFLEAHIFINLGDLPSSVDKAVESIQLSHRPLAEYAAQYWIVHYSMAEQNELKENSSAFSKFVANESNIRNWVLLVNHFLQFAPSEISVDILDKSLNKYLNFKCVDDLVTLYQLVLYQPPISGTSRLFIHAAQYENRELLLSLCMDIDSIDQEAIITAAAVANGELHKEVMRAIDHRLDKNKILYSRIQLKAQTVGSVEISDQLLAHLLDSKPADLPDDWYINSLKIAVDHQDESTLRRLLGRTDLVGRIKIGEEPRWTILHSAVNTGDIKVSMELLNGRFIDCINTLSPTGVSPLIIASIRGLTGVVRYLLSKGASVDLTGSSEKTALHFASQHGFFEIANELLSANADIVAADSEGNYALHLAIHYQMTSVARLLISKFSTIHGKIQGPTEGRLPNDRPGVQHTEIAEPNVNIDVESGDDETNEVGDSHSLYEPVSAPLNRANFRGMSALVQAAQLDMADTVLLLMQNGADPDIIDDQGRSALHFAAKADSPSMTETLITNHAALNLRGGEDDVTPLHLSCYFGKLKTMIKLIEAGADLEIRDSRGRTPIGAACASGHLLLVQTIAQKYTRQELDESLIIAAENGHREVASYLLEIACPVNITDSGGRTALLAAVQQRFPKMVEMLILRGANIETETRYSFKRRAIHFAAEIGSAGIVKLLTDRGAKIEVEDSNGRTALCTAIYHEYPEVVENLLRKGASMKMCSHWHRYAYLLDFSWGLSIISVTKVLLRFYKTNGNDDGLTPSHALIVAIRRDSSDLMDLVLDTWYNSASGPTLSLGKAIHFAASRGATSLLRKLLDHPLGPPSMNYEIPDVGTPLHAAIRDNSLLETTKLLLEYGVDPEIASGPFDTPINTACAMGNIKIANVLMEHHLSPKAIGSVTGRFGTVMQSAVFGFRGFPSNAQIKILADLLHRGASPSAVGGMYSTPLHAALNPLLSVSNDVALWLMDKDPTSICLRNLAGQVPLHLAILKGELRIVSEIAQLRLPDKPFKQHRIFYGGADVTARTEQGWVPRDIAILHAAADECLALLPEIGGQRMGLPDGRGRKLHAYCGICFSVS
ncbi:ankyrin repeat-containing domain protein [Xylariaceae sp. FL0255]|nr:ankyrin repeat-containing domain protein [Xylariaceae sp. FL0255]